ncbi:MAG TPA: T9SS type A sorting domain-containing protein [Balneolales bacterium]|nr:T9SS type A sorting domain-containing protein [Balneolales bacterium]
MKKKIFTNLFFFSLVLCCTTLVMAQSEDNATWRLTENDTTSAQVSGNLTAMSENIVGLASAYEPPTEPPSWWSTQLSTTKDTTIQKLKPDASTSGSQTNYWPDESSYNKNRYVEFAVGPKSGYTMTADSISMWIGSKGQKGFYAAIYYSTSKDFSSPTKIALLDSLTEHPSLKDTTLKGYVASAGLSIAVPAGKKIYIRVYPYKPGGKQSTSKYMYIGHVMVYGSTTKAVTTSNLATLTWMLNKSDTTSVAATGNAKASVEDTSGLQIGYDNSYTTDYVQKFKPNNSTSGSSGEGSWPQETSYNAKRYVQFAFGPKSGYDMTVDSLAMKIGDKGIKGMYADVYYSMSSDFSNPKALIKNDSLVEKAVVDTTLDGINSNGLGVTVKDGQTMYVRVYPWLRVSSTSTSKYLYLGDVRVYGATNTATAIEQPVTSTTPSKYKLEQNYPNPFNPTTNIAFQIPQKSMVTLSVYNILGQKVQTLVRGERAAGHYTVRFDGSALSSGVYIYRLKAGSFTQTKELTLIK